MIGHRSNSGSDAPARPFRDDREQKARARQAAEALFAPAPSPVVTSPPTDPPARQRRVLKPAPAPADRPPVEPATLPDPTAPVSIPPPHIARIRVWLKYGMTIAQVADAYRIPITEIKRMLGKL
jgi:hypothetical protein